jgi:acyl carrier protein
MTREQLRQIVRDALGAVAPEIDFDTLDSSTDLRQQCDLDSVDFYNIVLAIHASTGLEIPEVDYPKLATIDHCLDYLAAKESMK